jgi:hypothetical protein
MMEVYFQRLLSDTKSRADRQASDLRSMIKKAKPYLDGINLDDQQVKLLLDQATPLCVIPLSQYQQGVELLARLRPSDLDNEDKQRNIFSQLSYLFQSVDGAAPGLDSLCKRIEQRIRDLKTAPEGMKPITGPRLVHGASSGGVRVESTWTSEPNLY